MGLYMTSQPWYHCGTNDSLCSPENTGQNHNYDCLFDAPANNTAPFNCGPGIGSTVTTTFNFKVLTPKGYNSQITASSTPGASSYAYYSYPPFTATLGSGVC